MDVSKLPATRRESQSHKTDLHRRGLVPLLIGASYMVQCRDGKMRQYTAHSRGDVLEAAKAESREIAIKVVELTTQRTFANVDELRFAFGDETSMKLRNETRLWAFWSDDPQDPEQASKIDALEKEIQGRKAVIAKLRTALTKPDSVEQFDELRNKLSAQEKGVEEATKEIARLRDAIIGLMSDELHPGEYPAERLIPTVSTSIAPTAA